MRDIEERRDALARQVAEYEQAAVGHEANAQLLARWLWHVASVHGDRCVDDPRVQTLLGHYLPELRMTRAAGPAATVPVLTDRGW